MNNILSVPASKSYLQRALAVASLANATSVLNNVSWCNDSLSIKKIIEDLGNETIENNGHLTITPKAPNIHKTTYNVGESGLGLRMFSPIFALLDKEIILKGEGSLKTRPINMIIDALSQLSIKIESTEGTLPLKIRGPLSHGRINIDGSSSSQLLTGLLMALPLADGDSEITVDHLTSTPYIDMTLSIMKNFGVEVEHDNYKTFRIKANQEYQSMHYTIEGDWSGGAFFLIYGAVKNRVEINNLSDSSLQADKAIVDALRLAGSKVHLTAKSVIVENSQLNAFDFDATDCPDLFPPLVCLASQCSGTTKIKGISRLTHKESNRAETLRQEFSKMGINIRLENDCMYVEGGQIMPCEVDSHNDHRIAMAGGLMNLFCNGEIRIKNMKAVNKSYPGFFNDLRVLR